MFELHMSFYLDQELSQHIGALEMKAGSGRFSKPE